MADLSKEAITAIIQEVAPSIIEAWVQQNFNMTPADITQQFAIVNSASANAAQARLGALLGLQGQELVGASQKLLDYYEKLPPHERDKYQDDSAVVQLWQSMAAPDTSAPPTDTATASSGTKQWKQSEIDDMSSEDFQAQEAEIEAAYRQGLVLNDVDE